MSTFPGFGDDTFAYLSDLAEHNDRDWFTAHRDRYESAWLAPAVAFVDAMAPHVARLDPPATAQAKVNGSIWRIQRDTRFSKDKTPYKSHLAFLFWTGATKKEGSAYYVGLEADRSIHVGAGRWGFEKSEIEPYRRAVDSVDGERLGLLLGALESGGWQTRGEQLARVPSPYGADHPRGDLLRHKGLYVARDLRMGPDLGRPDVVDHVAAALKATSPLVKWLDGAL